MEPVLYSPSGQRISSKSVASTPAIIGIGKKSLNNPSAEDACIASAVQAHRGCDFVQPVLFDRKIIGSVEGRREDPRVTFRQAPPGINAAGYSSYDALITALTAGQRLMCVFSKTHTTAFSVATNWYDLWTVAGAPSAGAFTGAASVAVQFTDTTAGSLFTGGNVSTQTKHILSGWASSSANTPTLVMYDRVLTYEANIHNSAVNKAMTNTLTAQRYVTTGQSAMKIVCAVQTVQGATAGNLTQLRYTNQAGTTLQSVPQTTVPAFIISAVAPTSTLGARVICPATTAGTVPWSPYLPLAAGDGGVRLINDFTTSSAQTGTFTFILSRPLFSIGIATAGVVSQIDAIYQIASLERIFDGACIALMAYAPATTAATIQGSLDVGWN